MLSSFCVLEHGAWSMEHGICLWCAVQCFLNALNSHSNGKIIFRLYFSCRWFFASVVFWCWIKFAPHFVRRFSETNDVARHSFVYSQLLSNVSDGVIRCSQFFSSFFVYTTFSPVFYFLQDFSGKKKHFFLVVFFCVAMCWM